MLVEVCHNLHVRVGGEFLVVHQQLPDGFGQEGRRAVIAALHFSVTPVALHDDASGVVDLQLAEINPAVSFLDGGGDRGLDVTTRQSITSHSVPGHTRTETAVNTSGNERASTKHQPLTSYGAPWKAGGTWLWSLGAAMPHIGRRYGS